jgi:uncharacterized membrane protein YdjX (TVP38/TMEM64 family)
VTAPAVARRRAWNRLVGLFLLAGLLAAIALALGVASHDDAVRLADDRTVLAAALFVPLAVAVTVALAPSAVTATAAGVLFGTALGSALALAAVTAGTVLAVLLARWVAPQALHTVAGPRVMRAIALVERRSFLSLLYARLVPAAPQALITYVAGLTRAPLRPLTAASAIALAPRIYAYTALGGSFGDFGRPETVVAVAILAALGLAGGAAMVLERRTARRR